MSRMNEARRLLEQIRKRRHRYWITVIPIVHRGPHGGRRIGKLLPLRLEPGRKLIPGEVATIRGRRYLVTGFGYEPPAVFPVIHLLDSNRTYR